MKRFLYLVFLFTVVSDVMSQDGYTNGYIITYKNDTLRGRIRDRRFYYEFKASQKIKFKNDKGQIEKLRADDIKGYVTNDTNVYQALVLGIEEKKRFVRKLENGAVILFAEIGAELPANSQGNKLERPYIFVSLRGETQKRAGDYYLQKQNDKNSLMEWRSRDYKTTAKYFFKDNKELLKDIDDEKLKFEDLQKIVKEYNLWKFRQS